MDSFQVTIADEDVVDALREAAEVHGRSVEEEISAIVLRNVPRAVPPYPAGMEPFPGESFVDHIHRISRPGFDIELERDRTPHDGPDP